MNDRFKFRTYIPDKKFFKFWGWIKKGEYRGLCPSGENSLDELLEKYTSQSTGLKDKNGKLIYEGDIVRYICDSDFCSDGYHRCYPCSSGDKKIIFFDEDDTCFKYRDNGEDGDTYFFDCEIDTTINFEIIGNTFENKELLNEI